MKKIKINERFGKLVTVSHIGGKWLCKCDCGNHKMVLSAKLNNSHTTSCGCKRKETIRAKLAQQVGKHYGNWTVLQVDKKSSYFYCKCICGNEKNVATSSLYSGSSTNCGCIASAKSSERSLDNLIGKSFGNLLVKKRHIYLGKAPMWECECRCGKLTNVRGAHLKRGAVISCGSCRFSNEKRVREIFEKLLNKPFPKCKPSFLSLSKRQRLELDGFNEELKLAFEYDGEQHYKEVTNFKINLKYRQELDLIKDNLCKQNDITLIRIHFKYKKKLDSYILVKLKELGFIKE